MFWIEATHILGQGDEGEVDTCCNVHVALTEREGRRLLGWSSRDYSSMCREIQRSSVSGSLMSLIRLSSA